MSYNVLIVDDSSTMRTLIRKVLNMSGFDVGECFEGANGREALDIVEREWIDLILSDLHMPVMGGSALVAALHDHPLWRTIPVVLVTTETREALLLPLLKQGVKGYISKPFRPEEIRQTLTGILEESRATDDPATEGCDF
jgi:two-component system, chemotaxis family, chemotaxis protein CheY